MKDRLLEKYGDYTKVPLKSTEVSPGVPRSVIETPVTPRKSSYEGNPYIGKDGRDYDSLETLQSANDLWKNVNYLRSRRPLK